MWNTPNNSKWQCMYLKKYELDSKRALTFLHGFGVISNDALKAFLWALVSIVRGLFGDLVSQLMSLDTGDGSLLSDAEIQQSTNG